MEYVKLIDYLDRPELIRNVDGREVLEIRYDSEEAPEYQMRVEFKDDYDYYYPDGRYDTWNECSNFVLKEPNEHKTNLSDARTTVLAHATEAYRAGAPILSTSAYDELTQLQHTLKE
jgi:hypothetical protein